jgi:hypothetical protein
MSAQIEADKLRNEAKTLLHEQFCFMGRSDRDSDRDAVDRVIDCIIDAALLAQVAHKACRVQAIPLSDLQRSSLTVSRDVAIPGVAVSPSQDRAE